MKRLTKHLHISLFLFLLFPLFLSAQVGVNGTNSDPDPSAMLDVQSTDKGILIPRMTTAQRTAISSPATGLLVFDNETGDFWFYNGSVWTELGTEIPSALSDADGDTKIQVEASPDEDIMRFKAGSIEAMEIGEAIYGSVQTISSNSYFTDQLPGWQSFTAPEDADIISMEIRYNIAGGSSNKTFEIYEGEGTGGLLLASLGPKNLSNGWNKITLLTPVSMTSGQKYTFWFSTYAGVGYFPFNPYPDGQSSKSAFEDFSIRVNYVKNVGYTNINTSLDVSGPVTATSFFGDGSGLSNIGDNLGNHTATQTLNLANNHISNGATITAAAFVGNGSGLTNLPSSADNLGNHTATQNLKLNGNYLSGDGGNEGIRIDNNGNVGIGTTTPESLFHLKSTSTGSATGIKVSSGAYNYLIYGENGDLHLRKASETNQLVLDVNGRIGIGTDNPTQAKVVINGSVSSSLSYGWLNSSGSTGGAGSPTTNPYSLYASERIAASEFNAHSDMRIKNIRGTSNANEDLSTLMQIQITDYTLRDTIAKGNTPQKKVIAQQVAEVYPQAVSTKLTEVIPDIYQRAEVRLDYAGN